MVKDADPSAIEVDKAFSAAMEAPAKPRDVAPPPEVDQDAPLGRNEDGSPKTPWGLTKDGRVRRAPGGRRPKDESPRTGPADKVTGKVTGKKGPAPLPEPRDYSEALADSAEMVWLGLSAVGQVGSKLPIVGRFMPEDTIEAEAALFRAHSPRFCAAINLAAQHNARAARLAAKLADGDVTWQASCLFMVLPPVLHMAAALRGDEALESVGLPTREALSKQNKEDMAAYMENMMGQMKKAQEEAATQISEQAAEGTAA